MARLARFTVNITVDLKKSPLELLYRLLILTHLVSIVFSLLLYSFLPPWDFMGSFTSDESHPGGALNLTLARIMYISGLFYNALRSSERQYLPRTGLENTSRRARLQHEGPCLEWNLMRFYFEQHEYLCIQFVPCGNPVGPKASGIHPPAFFF